MLSVEDLKKYLDCDDDFIVTLINNFLEESKEMMDKMNSGLKSLDRKAIGSAAHKMLSSTRILKLDDLTSELVNLEKAIHEGAKNSKIEKHVEEINSRYETLKIEVKSIRDELKG
ncbi:MAG: Hpt domain-containing protein [Crocinitomicaceae bacterium]|nr:Hpt domain-containing protein [Crocinitomicaceae bacterium]